MKQFGLARVSAIALLALLGTVPVLTACESADRSVAPPVMAPPMPDPEPVYERGEEREATYSEAADAAAEVPPPAAAPPPPPPSPPSPPPPPPPPPPAAAPELPPRSPLTTTGILGDRGPTAAPSSPVRRPAARVEACASKVAGLSPFTWPEPALVAEIARTNVTAGETSLSVRKVADNLERSLKRAGYPDYSYYAAGCNGFVLIAHMERMRENATPLPAPDRWEFPVEEGVPPWDFIVRLFYAPPGQYRMISFVVTNEPLPPFRAAVTPTQLQRVLREGEDDIVAPDRRGDPFASVPFDTQYKVYALIYQFQKDGVDNRITTLRPVGVTVDDHLVQAGVFAGTAPR